MSADSPAYINGEFTPLSRVRISPLDRGFLFGDGIYEVIPVYGRHFLGLEGHLDRLASSLDGIQLNNPHTHGEWRSIFEKLVGAEPAVDKKIYVQVTRGVQEVRNHDFVGDEKATVFAMCSPQSPLGDTVIERGISLYTQEEIRWARCHLKTVSLLPNVLLKHASWQQGGAETLIVNAGRVVEGSSSNVFAVIDGTIHTPATGTEILPGITRSLVIDIAVELGFRVLEGELSLRGTLEADEVWISSSTRVVVAATSIDDVVIGSGLPGPAWRQVHDRFQLEFERLRNG